MSYKNNNKYCKVCKDAGKPETEYLSHNPKDGNKIICPTLKSTNCRYCHELGHTIKYCKTLLKKEKQYAYQTKNQTQTVQINNVEKKSNNLYSCLAEDSDEEEPQQIPVINDKISYANILKSTKKELEKPKELEKQKELKEEKLLIAAPWASVSNTTRKWTAWDSDEEDDEDEQKEEVVTDAW